MGHVRLGKLPATRAWEEVVSLMMNGNSSYEQIAQASAEAAEASLGSLAKDPIFTEVLWMLCKIPQAAKEKDFSAALKNLGISVSPDPTLAELTQGMSRAIDRCMRDNTSGRNDFGEMARHAAISSLTAMVQSNTPSLWAPTTEDVRHTVAHFASPAHFGSLAQEFFSRFTQRNLRYYLDRETPKHVGPGKYIPSLKGLDSFHEALQHHCQESSVIMRTFAKDWYGKKYARNEEITRKGVKGFSHVTVKKMRNELIQRRKNK